MGGVKLVDSSTAIDHTSHPHPTRHVFCPSNARLELIGEVCCPSLRAGLLKNDHGSLATAGIEPNSVGSDPTGGDCPGRGSTGMAA